MEIGTLRLLPKGTKVWSIPLQICVIFDEDVVIEITNRIMAPSYLEKPKGKSNGLLPLSYIVKPGKGLDKKNFFFKTKLLLFNFPGHIPTLVDRPNGDLGVINIDTTLPYKIPEPVFY